LSLLDGNLRISQRLLIEGPQFGGRQRQAR